MNYWLMKSEPSTYSIDDFAKDKKTLWTGVRNYQARNFMMNDMKAGDLFLFYHSNAEPPCAAGIGKIVRAGVVDPTALDKKSEYYEPKATKEKPIWHCAEVGFVEKFKTPVPLSELRDESRLKNMVLLKKGSRLSVQPVTAAEFEIICKMAK